MHLWHGGGRVCDIKAGKTKEYDGINAHLWSGGDWQGAVGHGGVSHRRWLAMRTIDWGVAAESMVAAA